MIDKTERVESREVRTRRDVEQEKCCFRTCDLLGVLPNSDNPRKYWSIPKARPKKESSLLATNYNQLKMLSADGMAAIFSEKVVQEK